MHAEGSTPPKVSVVIPCYNGRRYLDQCLQSVTEVMDMSYEAIVVDDGSTEPIADVVERYSPLVRYVKQENEGPSGARNRGVAQSRGKYIAFLDADDWLLDSSSRREQITLLDAHPEVGLVYGQSVVVNSYGRTTGVRRCPFERNSYVHPGAVEIAQLLRRNHITTSTTVVRHDVLERAGPFRPGLSIGEDWIQWIAIARLSSVGYIARPVAAYRRHDQSTSARNSLVHFRQQHYQCLDDLFADPEFADRFGELRKIAYAAQDLIAAEGAYGAREMGLARRWSWRALRSSLKSNDFRTAAASLTLLGRTVVPASARATYRSLKQALQRSMGADPLAAFS
jgi:glycosyltransferase involved in cell wall biosynthesis